MVLGVKKWLKGCKGKINTFSDCYPHQNLNKQMVKQVSQRKVHIRVNHQGKKSGGENIEKEKKHYAKK